MWLSLSEGNEEGGHVDPREQSMTRLANAMLKAKKTSEEAKKIQEEINKESDTLDGEEWTQKANRRRWRNLGWSDNQWPQ